MRASARQFSGLAGDYARFRPDYPDALMQSLEDVIEKPLSDVRAVDIGAGTGRWTRQMAKAGVGSIVAIEPSAGMRDHGVRITRPWRVDWRNGSGADTGLPGGIFDLVTWASSIHCVEIAEGLRESIRLLRPGGCLAILSKGRTSSSEGRRRPDNRTSRGRRLCEAEIIVDAVAGSFPDCEITTFLLEETHHFTSRQAVGYLRSLAHLRKGTGAPALRQALAEVSAMHGQRIAWTFVTWAVIVQDQQALMP